MKNVERYLNSFGKYVIKQARTNLTKKKKNVNKKLYNSLKFKVVKNAKGDYSVEFYMLDYGTFVDKGVSGTKKQQSYRNAQNKVVATDYKYTSKQPPSGIIEKWIAARGIKGRNVKGQFTSITRKSLSFLIARSIKRKGIKGVSFFSRPIYLGTRKFGQNILDSMKKDIVNEVKKNM
tara:strand:+ start:493 stop:1023 length:531 start_codon:yes stop_codon:yes gene_type:complete